MFLTKYFYIGLLLFSLKGILMNAQPLNYSTRKELLQEQFIKLSVIYDSTFSIGEYPINGTLFYSRSNKFIHPFFIDNDWRSAKIWSSDKVYNIEMVKYDIDKDYLVHLYHRDSFAYPIYLNKESVKEFMISGHLFRYLNDFGKSFVHELNPGYYEILYDGPTKVCVRWEKVLILNNDTSDPVYSQRIYFFFKMNGIYIRVTDQKSFLNAFNDHSKELKIYMKKNKLRFSRNNYEVLSKLVEYYDNL